MSTLSQILTQDGEKGCAKNNLTFLPPRVTIQQTPADRKTCFGGSFFDHISDHIRCQNIRRQWRQERRRAPFSERKGPKTAVSQLKNVWSAVWDQETRSSSLRTSTRSVMLHTSRASRLWGALRLWPRKQQYLFS